DERRGRFRKLLLYPLSYGGVKGLHVACRSSLSSCSAALKRAHLAYPERSRCDFGGTGLELQSRAVYHGRREVPEMKKTLIAFAIAALVATPLGAWAAEREGKVTKWET